MKKLFLTIAIVATLLFSAIAQLKHDFIWLFGSYPNNPSELFGGSQINFNTNPPDVSYFNLPPGFDFQETSMISDTSGQLLFYTNGCSIVNWEHQVMINGDSINPGEVYDESCVDGDGYPSSQGSIILPMPGSSHLYYLFHIKRNESLFNEYLLYSIVDMEKNGGLGEVVEKNQLLLSVHHFGQQLIAARHANGRDWWLVLPYGSVNINIPSNKYYKFLFTPEVIAGPYEQEIGEPWNFQYWSGQAAFSPDGKKYARVNPFNGLRLFNFDRCSGDFSNPKYIDFPGDTIISSGVAFSPNSRFMYVSASAKVYQFDIWSSDIVGSRKTVAVYDGFMSPLPTRFYQQKIAPDGKIYITVPNSANVLHVIHKPDLLGDSCEFEQHGLVLPSIHDWSIPNFPFFRLYDEPGSSCDTLGIDNPVATVSPILRENIIQVFPNPASHELTLSFTAGLPATEWTLNSQMGQVLKKMSVPPGQQAVTISLEDLPPGLYFWQLRSPGRLLQSGKLVVSK